MAHDNDDDNDDDIDDDIDDDLAISGKWTQR